MTATWPSPPGESTADVLVRPARPDEYPIVGDLTVGAYRFDGYVGAHSDYAETLRDAQGRAEAAELLVAVTTTTAPAAGGVLGSVTVAGPTTRYADVARPGELEFRMLAVAPAARGRGVGEILVRAVIAAARDRGADRVVLSSQETMHPAHRLYTRIGFRRAPDRDWSPVPDVRLHVFTLDLTTPEPITMDPITPDPITMDPAGS